MRMFEEKACNHTILTSASCVTLEKDAGKGFEQQLEVGNSRQNDCSYLKPLIDSCAYSSNLEVADFK